MYFQRIRISSNYRVRKFRKFSTDIIPMFQFCQLKQKCPLWHFIPQSRPHSACSCPVSLVLNNLPAFLGLAQHWHFGTVQASFGFFFLLDYSTIWVCLRFFVFSFRFSIPDWNSPSVMLYSLSYDIRKHVTSSHSSSVMSFWPAGHDIWILPGGVTTLPPWN